MTVLVGLLLACAAWAVAASILITVDLEKRGLETNILGLRWMIFKYLGQYRQITRLETGRTGPLYYHYIVPINIALALTVILVIMAR